MESYINDIQTGEVVLFSSSPFFTREYEEKVMRSLNECWGTVRFINSGVFIDYKKSINTKFNGGHFKTKCI